MGLRHARVFSRLREAFELVGAYDVRDDVDLPPYVRRLASEDEAIGSADAVVVATPIEAHAEAATRALAAGKHVLVEKPLCDAAHLAEALLATSARCGARVYAGHSERFNPVVRALSRLLRDNRVHAIDLERVGPARRTPQGVLLNLGVHDFDLASYLGGGDVTLQSALGRGSDGRSPASPVPGRNLEQPESEDIAHVLFETSGGALGHIHVDRTRAVNKQSLTVVTTRWVYEGDLLAHRLVRAPRHGGLAADVPLSIEEPLAAQALAFAAALRGSSSRELASGADGARAVRLAELAAALCRSGARSPDVEKLSVLVRP